MMLEPRELFAKWHKEHPELFSSPLQGDNRGSILLIYITPSGHGLKIVFKARTEWGNLIDNQHSMAKVLGVEVDESCKDASRMSFICKEEDILYIDKELFTYENKAYGEKYDEEYRNGHSGETHTSPLPHKEGTGESLAVSALDERIRFIANGVMKEKGLMASDFLNEGGRHTTVKILLSGVTQLLKKDETNAALKELMPDHWQDENIQQLVDDFYANYTNPNQRLLKYQEQLFTKSQRIGGDNNSQGQNLITPPSVGGAGSLPTQGEMERVLWEWGAQIEALSEDFPLFKDICKGLKSNQYPAALIVAGAFGMTLMTRCTYRFYHRPEELRRLNSSALIIGDPASGKSFATRLFKLMAAPIVAADKVGRDAINAYREQMRTKGANKEKPKKPKVVVRVHPARTSNAQFIQDMVNAVEMVDGEEMHLHMLTFDTELDNTICVQKGGSWIDKMSMELKAFHNEEDGQAYSNMDSILQDFNVYWNYVYTGTPIALKKKVNEQNFGSGLATRLTCIPLPATNFEMMGRESTVDLESDNRLKEWAVRLDRMKGILSLDKIVDELYEWTARRMMDAKENDSKADEMLLKRCAYHGLNYAAPFIVMRHWDKMHKDGEYWCGEFETDEVDWKLAELIVNMQYACQRHYFGAMAEAYFDNKLKDASVNVQRKQKTIEGFDRLPEKFSIEDVVRCFNLGSDASARKKVTRLQRDHLVEKISEEKGKQKALYRKTGTIIL